MEFTCAKCDEKITRYQDKYFGGLCDYHFNELDKKEYEEYGIEE